MINLLTLKIRVCRLQKDYYVKRLLNDTYAGNWDSGFLF